jgi:hypothetical protein
MPKYMNVQSLIEAGVEQLLIVYNNGRVYTKVKKGVFCT